LSTGFLVTIGDWRLSQNKKDGTKKTGSKRRGQVIYLPKLKFLEKVPGKNYNNIDISDNIEYKYSGGFI
jgi:hypothetical protein